MDQLRNTTVRFGMAPALDLPGEGWKGTHVPFSPPFGSPLPGTPKGIAQGISVVVTPFGAKCAPVIVVKDVTDKGFMLWARNVKKQPGSALFSWLAVLGVPEAVRPRPYDVRLGVLQTKILNSPTRITEWPGVWYSKPLVGVTADTEPSILLTAHNVSGPSREEAPWRSAASVGIAFSMKAPQPAPLEDGFSMAAVNVENDGRAGFYYASFIDVSPHFDDTTTVESLWLDHGSENNVEDSHLYLNSPWLTPPNRRLSPGAEDGDWTHLDVYFDRPFLTPPIVLATARDTERDPKEHTNPLALIAQNVTTHGFTMAVRNTDTVGAQAKFYWIALGCSEGCG